jgi:hypothetical protein
MGEEAKPDPMLPTSGQRHVNGSQWNDRYAVACRSPPYRPADRRNDKKLTDYKDANRQTPPPLNATDCPRVTRVLKCELTPHPPRSAPERDGADLGAVSLREEEPSSTRS